MDKWLSFLKKQLNKFKNNGNDRGAIVVEATISLTAFVFAILIVLSIADMAYVQAKMQIAVNAAAKEMSQYSYLYSVLNMQEHMSGEGGKSSELLESLSQVLNTIGDATEVLSEDVSQNFLRAANTAEGDSAAEYAKDALGMVLAKQLVKKNLVSYDGDNADAFLRRCHVVDGLSGLNFLYTSFLTDVNQSEIDIVIAYKIRVLRLLDMEFDFPFIQRATTKAWGLGVSLAEPSSTAPSQTASLWDAGQASRGKAIADIEKQNYQYTSSRNGFHAYEPDDNRFVRIRSINTFDETYTGADGQKNIKTQLNSTFSSLYSGVAKVGDNVNLVSNGKDVTMPSNKDTRTYKIVLIVPEGSDMTKVNGAVSDFKSDKKSLGYDVEVEVLQKYGSPTPKTEEGDDQNVATDTQE